MVCLQNDEASIDFVVIDNTGINERKISLNAYPTTPISQIFSKVATELAFCLDELELVLQNKMGYDYLLNDYKNKSVKDIGLDNFNIGENQIIVRNRISYNDCAGEDDLLLGASASPTTGELPPENAPLLVMNDYDNYAQSSRSTVQNPIIVQHCNYVGLVNQAMTCYLNSLLQTLYMTPEFRNALYNWEFDGQNEHRSIPFQLQKLFLNLQTSNKSAVETTDLTTSFGWQGSDAWHQHDIQELCRVMFDALEQKFKDTKQSNLINDLYEGKMLDYVKCLECGTEKSREDTFQDIPLPVRPFGSNVAYNSVEEALRAFVQPETLDGNNQYFCEKCNKKCDAHKGLKFTKFPYLLTLHLKRFDFDYNTMHRIKLNDKVTFPEKLNLNSFIPVSKGDQEPMEEKETVVKYDDCSTTDSGSADDESCQGTDVSSTVNGQDDNCVDSDEGIDVSSGNNHNSDAKGPYTYELFSIMIHSGSASGGHYYVYIKDFDKNQWFCFNDQTVNAITIEEVMKSYGGGTQRGYYSGAYSSSTNAYMLMYRQIDKARNARAMDVNNFPSHIKELLKIMRMQEEEDRINRQKENNMLKLNIYCYHPVTRMMSDLKISVYSDATLAEAANHAHYRFKLGDYVQSENCRLVIYNKKHDCIDSSFDSDDLRFCDIKHSINIFTEWFLEIKHPDEDFCVYKAGGINMKVYCVQLDTEDVDEPKYIRVDIDDKVIDLKVKLAHLMGLEINSIKVVLSVSGQDSNYLDNDDEIVKFDSNYSDHKLFIASIVGEETETTFKIAKLRSIIERFSYLVSLNVILPDTDVATLESLSIPSLDLNQNLDKLELNNTDKGTSSPVLRISPQPCSTGCDGFGDQSNSEDSSLSDSDRTLVGDAPGELMSGMHSNGSSPADQHMASPTDPAEDNYDFEVFGNPCEEQHPMHWDDEETQDVHKLQSYYFKVTSVSRQRNGDMSVATLSRCVRVLVDKRMTLERFKKHLEVFVRVPVEYFKVYRHYGTTEEEWSSVTDSLRTTREGERIVIKLGRVLKKDEFNCKIYHLKPDFLDTSIYLFDHIISKGQIVGVIKKEILIQMKKQFMIDILPNRCRLREKSWKKPRKVYLDHEKFGDAVIMTSNMEFYLQELNDIENFTSSTYIALFVRQWCPSTLTLKPISEVCLESSTVEELKKTISTISNIPLENVDIALCKSTFPCDMHVLEINEDLTWNPNVTNLEQWPLTSDDGSTFFFRDNREKLKELTTEERKEINQRENSRLGRHTVKSPNRERALKIYLDTSPGRSEDNCID